ncbi:helix-turn-helix domain-containing protein [Streptomyces coelicoflavus]|uniref:helix-turn-helix domain-containing protein n=1 Tax=Streptomyces coelicoflavus TaxID=285562 RepID=UPI000D5902FC|nr:helix-turn-helix domain-containing protein [Streptomyces coelicoflavus]
MIGTVLKSTDVSAPDRFSYWQECIGRTRACEITSDHTDNFQAEMRLMELGPVTVWPTSFQPARYRRTCKIPAHSSPETYHLTLLLDGHLTLDLAGQTHTFGARDLFLIDNFQQYDLQSLKDGQRHIIKGVGVDFPKELLPLPPHRLHRIFGQPLSGRDGMGAVVAEFLMSLERQAETIEESNAPHLGTILLDLLSSWLTQALEFKANVPKKTRQQAMMKSIRLFIRQNLPNPDLSPPIIAAAHHISLSYLHRIFEQQGRNETVAAYIRSMRMENARRDLKNPLLRATPIYEIAFRWGFCHASDFTRTFRSFYGKSPKEYRSQKLSENT